MSQLIKNYNILLRPITSLGSLSQCFAHPHSKQMFPSAQADCPLVQLCALFPFCHWFPGAEFSTSLCFPSSRHCRAVRSTLGLLFSRLPTIPLPWPVSDLGLGYFPLSSWYGDLHMDQGRQMREHWPSYQPQDQLLWVASSKDSF